MANVVNETNDLHKRYSLISGPGNESSVLTFGLLVNGLDLEAWQAEAVQLLVSEGHILKFVVVNGASEIRPTILKRIKSYPFNKILFRLWHRYLFRPYSKKAVSLSFLLSNTQIIRCTPIIKKQRNLLPDDVIAQLKSFQPDFILRFGFNIISGAILELAPFGVWSFHHGDEMLYRGGPPGFWEFMHHAPSNGVILQKLTEELDKGFVLKKNWYPVVYHSYKSHLNQIYSESTLLPLQVCRQIQSAGFSAKLSETKARIFHPPTNGEMLHFVALSLYRRLAFHLKDLFRQEDWHVGIQDKSAIPKAQEGNPFSMVPLAKKGCYTADPDVIRIGDDDVILAEEFSYRNGKGRIIALKSSESFQKTHLVLEEENHLSFPHVFKANQKTWMIPESWEAKAIKLYEIEPESLKASFVESLLTGYEAVDPILFQHQNRWWLFFTLKSMPSVHLYAFYSDAMTGPFLPHHQNPVKSDIRSARNAGKTYVRNHSLFRPAQDCSLHYGRAINICEIVSLTPELFEEQIVERIEPKTDTSFSRGVHTLNSNEQYTVFDGKRFSSSWQGFRHQLHQKVRRLK